jgi:hypothetical protein
MSSKITYVTRDIERALGFEPGANYRIITNETPFSMNIKAQYPEYVTLIKNPAGLASPAGTYNTAQLLDHPQSVQALGPEATILVFKNSLLIESIAKKHSWHILNPPAALSEEIENKITQVAWLGDLADKYLSDHEIKKAADIAWNEKSFILQWAHGHTGDGTILVSSKDELVKIQQEFPERIVRKTALVKGPSFTVNVCVDATRILMGNVSYQITGLPPFTDNAFSTIGNDWTLSGDILTEHDHASVEQMVADISKKMQDSGWKGLFGLDLMHDIELNQLFLIEVNARQPASTTYESELQRSFREQGIVGCTMMEAHLDCLADHAPSIMPIIVNDGAQIIARKTKVMNRVEPEMVKLLEAEGNRVIVYENTEPNSDLLRIQNPRGILQAHNKLNSRGQKIADIILGK